MSYYFSKTLSPRSTKPLPVLLMSFKKEGFGVPTEIDVKETLKKVIESLQGRRTN